MKHITIIGAGLGGLTAGALLAKKGYKVTILEQHNIVGGCATTFKRKNFICEVGLHEMDGVYSNKEIKEIFNQLDVYKNITFLKAPEFFKTITKNDSFTMPHGLNNAIEALNKRFPKEKRSIEKYFKIIETINKEYEHLQNRKWYHYIFFPIYFYSILKYKNKSVTDTFNKLFSNEQIKIILNTNVQYYNDTPETLSFLLHALAQYSYYREGGYFIQGGSQKLSDYFASIVINSGGEVITRANVIRCNKKSVTFIKKKDQLTFQTDIIISNLSPQSTYKLFNQEYIESKETADSLLTTYICFSKNLKELYGKGAYSSFILENVNNISDYNKTLQKSITQRDFVFIDYSQIDSKLSKSEKKSFGVICMQDYLHEWKELSAKEYKEKKVNLEKNLIQRLEKYYPNISKYIEYIETGTSKTVQSYIKTPNATAYGFKPTPKQFFRIPQIQSEKIDNLYFVGQWVIAGGFRPCIYSGKLCVDRLLKETQ